LGRSLREINLSRENKKAIPPQAHMRNKSMSGSGGGGGYEYQARAAGYVAAHILAQEPLAWIEHESPDVPVAVAEETGGAGDDLCITLHDGVEIELQAKHGLQKDKLWEPLIKLGQGLQENSQLYGVLLTDTTASKIIREDLRNDFKRLGQGRTDQLKSITQKAQQKFVEANLPESDADFFRRLRIVVLDLDDGLQDGKHVQLLLSKVLHDPKQSANVWKILCGEGLELISNRGRRDSKSWARFLSCQGIQLASKCAQINGVMSLEERNYLESVRNKFEAWWEPQAFMDEIDESTWFEFGLNTKVPRPKDENNPSQNNNNNSDKEITIPILDALSQSSNERILIVGKPGAGKSTLLKQILLRSSKKALENSNAPIPVLIELNRYTQQPNILNLIKAAFEKRDFLLVISEQEKLSYIENLIKDKRLLLLVDGVNGLSRETRSALMDFCERDLAIIVTMREVDAGNLGIRKKLEIQPLRTEEVEEFFNKKLLSDQSRIKELCERVSDFSQTPLMVWMLYSIFRHDPQSETPKTRGEAYRRFTTIYVERGKEDIDLGEWRSQLNKLAFKMTCSEGPVDENQVHSLLGTPQSLEQLLNNHLLQRDSESESRKVEFCHPSLQEYFTAEYLLPNLTELIKELPNQDYTEFQITYLNKLKWTEAIALMLGLPEVSADQSITLIEQALKVDLGLGARLAGEVKPEIQARAIRSVQKSSPNSLVKIALIEITKSEQATDFLKEALNHTEVEIRRRAARALGSMPESTAIPLIEIALKNSDSKVCEMAILALRQFRSPKVNSIFDTVLSSPEKYSSDTRIQTLLGLEDMANEVAIFSLLKATSDPEHDVKRLAIHILKEELDRSLVIKTLTNASESQDMSIAINSIKMLGKLEDESTIPHLEKMELSPIEEIGDEATESLFFLRSKPVNILKSHHQPADVHDDFEKKIRQKIREHRAELESENPIRRGNALIHLASLIGKDIIPLVLKFLDDPDTNVRFSACNIIATRLIREFPEELESLQKAIPKLITILEDKNSPPCGEAISALGQLGDMTACPTLSKLCSEENSYVRGRAIESLVQLSCSEAPPILIGALKDPDALVRSKAARGLSEIQCEESIPALIDLLKDPDVFVQSSIPEVLGKFQGNSTAKYLPTLFERITTVGEIVLYAISAIQSHCGFYNNEFLQKNQDIQNSESNKFIDNLYNDIENIISNIQRNPEVRQHDNEDRLTVEIVTHLRGLGYSAHHDPQVGGHVDILVEKNNFTWLGEAKIFGDNNDLWEGFQQLTTRYSNGDINQNHVGLIIYIFKENVKLIMEKWQSYLQDKNIPNYDCKPVKPGSSVFTSSYMHQSSGQIFHVRHMPIILHFDPKDRSGRRRKK
jgi:HEAT repeat protein/energy-coupling factor transporter ATP-binding protein EcfA2